MINVRLAFTLRAIGSGVLLAAVFGTSGCKTRQAVLEPQFNDGDGSANGDGASGGGGGRGGGGGHDGAAGEGGGPGDAAGEACKPMEELCDGYDDDCDGVTDEVDPAKLLDDLRNCGACGVICAPPASEPKCAGGTCTYKCLMGAFDADGKADNGCECAQTNSGVELCDSADNDCDGMTDEDFDTKKDLAHCGGCGKRCAFPYAAATCADGVCKMGACLPNFYDRDGKADNGCEEACLVSNGGKEACDGADNDCDGMTDEDLGPAPITCRSQGSVCAGVMPTCKGAKGWVCEYGADFEEAEDKAKGCDGKDNDCDGKTDEAYAIGTTCTVPDLGPCGGVGVWVCGAGSPDGRVCNATATEPKPEVCDGKDNDCDGKIDELQAGNATTDDRLVYFPGKDVTMFAYEATRFDAPAGGGAAGDNAGFDGSRRPCSVPDRLPWTNVTKEEAEAACKKIGTGWRLCTPGEWTDACNGTAFDKFPYGESYEPDACNGFDYDRPAPYTSVIPTGSASQCLSSVDPGDAAAVLFDMSGNVKEWVKDGGGFQMRGGAYNIQSFGSPATSPGLQCDAFTPAPSVPVRLPAVGFRCCKAGTL